VRGIVCWLVSLSGPLAERRGFVWLAASVAGSRGVQRSMRCGLAGRSLMAADNLSHLRVAPIPGADTCPVARLLADLPPRWRGETIGPGITDWTARNWTRTYALHLLEIGLQAIQLSSYRAGPAAAHLRRLRDVRCFTDMLLFPFPFRSR
jgi:hypothetical protein